MYSFSQSLLLIRWRSWLQGRTAFAQAPTFVMNKTLCGFLTLFVVQLCLGCAGRRPIPAPAIDADTRALWLLAHAIPLATTDPTRQDLGDLEPLRALVGNSRIVL